MLLVLDQGEVVHLHSTSSTYVIGMIGVMIGVEEGGVDIDGSSGRRKGVMACPMVDQLWCSTLIARTL